MLMEFGNWKMDLHLAKDWKPLFSRNLHIQLSNCILISSRAPTRIIAPIVAWVVRGKCGRL